MRQTIPTPQRSKRSFSIFVIICLACCVATGVFLVLREKMTPAVEKLVAGQDLHSPGALATEIFDSRGRKIGEISDESRYYVGIDMMPQILVKAFIAAEDDDFLNHNGVSFKAILRAAWANVTSGKIVQGGSTITQQLARISFLNNQQTLKRKLREALLALTLEATLSKRRILELYLNRIFLGNHSYGVEAAARNYFRKSVMDLNVAESAMLAGLAAAPSSYAPNRHWHKAKARQRFVLRRLQEEGYLTEQQRLHWEAVPLKIANQAIKRNAFAPYFMTEVKQQMDRMFEINQLSAKGMRIDTTLDLSIQNHISRQLQISVKKYFEQKDASNDLRAAMLIIDANTGAIIAMQGGASYANTQFNHAIHAERPMGSLFMPIYYALALERGFSLMSSLYTQGESVPQSGEVGLRADLTLFEGLIGAKAVESSRLVAWLGAGTVAQQADEFGLPVKSPDLSLALGRNKASLIKVLGAFAAFQNGGYRVRPYAILRVRDKEGKPLFIQRPFSHQVTGQDVAHLIKETMQLATQAGAAQGGYLEGTAVSGFVGTDKSGHDAWYVGAVGNWIAGLWVGSDKGQNKLMEDSNELQESIGLAWGELMTPILPKGDNRVIQPPAGISYARYRFNRENLGIQSVPFRLRDEAQAF